MENAWWDSVGALDIKKATVVLLRRLLWDCGNVVLFVFGEGFVYVLLTGVDT